MSARLPVSVVIPCLRDELPLERLLGQLRQAERDGGPPLQIIVVDAAASEPCQALCRRHGALWSPAVPCRGEQLRQGAALAEHDILWFLHADAELDGQPLAALRQAVSTGAAGGYFSFRFSGTPGWQGRLLERLVAWRNQVGVPYGDQGLFARRSAYYAVGQHAPWPLFEEVPLVEGLREHGDFRCIRQGLRVSPRRWQRDGWWRRACRNRLLAMGFILGIAPTTLARLYAGKPRTGAMAAQGPTSGERP
ncbi:glycosyltransferase [Azotobacter chroococcum]|uniref:Group 2 family glycosyl transferase n=1 Tax=Azotobacter chroococcum NCIMB 8003 TaxID=1328314 RepID=A0A0C4WME7_9GAMM|nr:glycosyltransferase [Azotobacter chroococcum]AJE21516.1 Group 2 family glycosyl transferase [Azotobacter chroococcum NCIMB 8003]